MCVCVCVGIKASQRLHPFAPVKTEFNDPLLIAVK